MFRRWRQWQDLMAASLAPSDRPPLRAITVADLDAQIDFWRAQRASGTWGMCRDDVDEVLDRLLDRRNALTTKGTP